MKAAIFNGFKSVLLQLMQLCCVLDISKSEMKKHLERASKKAVFQTSRKLHASQR